MLLVSVRFRAHVLRLVTKPHEMTVDSGQEAVSDTVLQFAGMVLPLEAPAGISVFV